MENTQLSDLKNRLEALLFSSGKPMHLEELSRITKEKDLKRIEAALVELKKDLDEKKSSIMLIQDGDEWKLAVREHYMPFVRKVVSTTELPRTILQTLAVVAHKAPVMQSQVIKIRTNKAYHHLDFLEEKGYITREKKGRTKLIKLTQKFFEYFDIPSDKLKEKFAGFKELEQVIEKKEQELEHAQKPEVFGTREGGKQGKLEEIDILEAYDVKESSDVMKEMLGGLEIYKTSEKLSQEEPIEKIKKVEKEAKLLQKELEKKKETPELKEKEQTIQEKKPQPKKKVKEILAEAKKKTPKKREYKSKGLFPKGIPPKIQEKIDEKVEEMIEGKEEEENADSAMPEVQE
ncbi:SMC-Scp complex subunit ScpB [Candidatus Woesearchaeota archaeon]|nr:SMC-Scp complex subunit ScpB [Candidatus Woesearchaeota archaeon]